MAVDIEVMRDLDDVPTGGGYSLLLSSKIFFKFRECRAAAGIGIGQVVEADGTTYKRGVKLSAGADSENPVTGLVIKAKFSTKLESDDVNQIPANSVAGAANEITAAGDWVLVAFFKPGAEFWGRYKTADAVATGAQLDLDNVGEFIKATAAAAEDRLIFVATNSITVGHANGVWIGIEYVGYQMSQA